MPAQARRWTDASKLSFPIQFVLTLVGAFLAAVLAVKSAQADLTAANAALQSDVRVILTKMDAEKQVAEANAKLTEAANAQLKATVDAMSRRQELQQMQIAELQKSLLILTEGRRR